MAFHLGVLRWLAEEQQFERITMISSVSGGSLLMGLIFHESEYRWPTSHEFLTRVYPAIRHRLTERSMQWGAMRQLMIPSNMRHLFSRANLLAAALRREWGIAAKLTDLPSVPEWSINGTNAENGRRFRFKRESMGDYLSGYAASGDFPLADAMAVSAAFPGGFGPLSLPTKTFRWMKREWDAPSEHAREVELPTTIHLYDGGVYDNLGLEPFFDAGRLQPKHQDHFILVSDAGMPLQEGFKGGALNPFRLKRVADIMSDQARALRVRTFSYFLQENEGQGALVYIGNSSDAGGTAAREFAAAFPTTLRAIPGITFDRLAGHGYQLTRETLPNRRTLESE